MKKTLAIILSIIMLMGMLPFAASAADGVKQIMLGTSVLSENVNTANAPSVYFGLNHETANSPAKWRVIGYDGNAVASASGDMTLLAAYNMGQARFDNDGTSNVYADSDLKTAIDALAGKLETEEEAVIAKRTLAVEGYSPNSPYSNGIEGEEVSDAVFWPLSAKEANEVSQDLRIVDSEHQNWATSYWLLRSPGLFSYRAAYVSGSGFIDPIGYSVDGEIGVRPAFNINLESVLFISAAEGGKTMGTLAAPFDYTGDEWKLTVLDESRTFDVTQTALAALKGETIELNYTGAGVGENEYVSALIVDENGNVLYYGQIVTGSASGTATFALPEDLALGKYTLKVFSEQLNGDYMTDYASAFEEIALTVYRPYTVKFNANGGDVTLEKADTNSESKLAELPTPTRTGYTFGGWYLGETEVAAETVFTEDSEIIAKWTECIAHEDADEDAVCDLCGGEIEQPEPEEPEIPEAPDGADTEDNSLFKLIYELIMMLIDFIKSMVG